jgi:Sec-independent protein translocase protein TatA
MPDLLIVLIVLLVIVVIWRGPKTIPLIGGMLGRGVKEVRKEASDIQKDQDATSGDQTPPAPPA